MVRIIKVVTPLVIVFLIFLIYSFCCGNLASNLLRWGEIVVVISLLAGVYKLIFGELVKIRKKNIGSIYSIVTVVAFICTFLAGIINFRSEEFAFSNIVREHPDYLVKTTQIVIEDDEYLRKFPAKKKLSLLMASRISSYFIPTDDMLKNSGMSSDDYQELINPGMLQDKAGIIQDGDLKYAKKVQEKVTTISRNTVRFMLPVVQMIKEWSYFELSRPQGHSQTVEDLNINGTIISGSGAILAEEIKRIQPTQKKDDFNKMIDIYSIICKNEKFLNVVSNTYAKKTGSGISEKAAKNVITAFVKTGVAFSPRLKGVLRWIYRYIYDPLFSTFMAVLVFFMVIAAYRHFDLRKYSTAVITLSAVFVMAGFIPQVQLFLIGVVPNQWQGPLTSGWIMNVFAMPVFKAFAIGTGTGVIFMYISRYWRSFPRGGSNEK